MAGISGASLSCFREERRSGRFPTGQLKSTTFQLSNRPERGRMCKGRDVCAWVWYWLATQRNARVVCEGRITKRARLSGVRCRAHRDDARPTKATFLRVLTRNRSGREQGQVAVVLRRHRVGRVTCSPSATKDQHGRDGGAAAAQQLLQGGGRQLPAVARRASRGNTTTRSSSSRSSSSSVPHVQAPAVAASQHQRAVRREAAQRRAAGRPRRGDPRAAHPPVVK
jgi:hypothetical protein